MNELLIEIEKYAEDNDIPIMDKEGIDFLTNFISNRSIVNILEIGSAIGYSSIKMALVDKKIKITTIERDNKRYLLAVDNIGKMNLNNQISIINEDAFNVELDNKFDLIFIDGAKAQSIKFFEKFSPMLSENGYIVTDNLNFHGFVDNMDLIKGRNLRGLVKKIRLYIEFLKDNNEYKTEFLNIGDGISISSKK